MISMVTLFVLAFQASSTLAINDTQAVDEAVLPLPDDLRDGATVVRIDESGKREVLRQGRNHLICRADSPRPGFHVACYVKELDAYITKLFELEESGESEAEIGRALSEEIEAGRVQLVDGGVMYVLQGPSVIGAKPITVVYMPNATPELTGLSGQPNHYRPWLMLAGTQFAHIMIPGK